jgi:hypothetical protein
MFFRRESLPLCFSAEGIPSGCNLLPLHGDKGVLYDSIRTVRYTVRGPLPPYETGSAGDCSSPIGKSWLIYGTATCNCFSIYCSLTKPQVLRREMERLPEERRKEKTGWFVARAVDPALPPTVYALFGPKATIHKSISHRLSNKRWQSSPIATELLQGTRREVTAPPQLPLPMPDESIGTTTRERCPRPQLRSQEDFLWTLSGSSSSTGSPLQGTIRSLAHERLDERLTDLPRNVVGVNSGTLVSARR